MCDLNFIPKGKKESSATILTQEKNISCKVNSTH